MPEIINAGNYLTGNGNYLTGDGNYLATITLPPTDTFDSKLLETRIATKAQSDFRETKRKRKLINKRIEFTAPIVVIVPRRIELDVKLKVVKRKEVIFGVDLPVMTLAQKLANVIEAYELAQLQLQKDKQLQSKQNAILEKELLEVIEVIEEAKG